MKKDFHYFNSEIKLIKTEALTKVFIRALGGHGKRSETQGPLMAV